MAAIEISDLVQAQMIVTLPASAIDPTVVAQRGFVEGNGARTGLGEYTFDLDDDAIDVDSLMVLMGNGATAAPVGAFVSAELVAGTPNQLILRTFSAAAGAAADVGLRAMVELHRLPSNS